MSTVDEVFNALGVTESEREEVFKLLSLDALKTILAKAEVPVTITVADLRATSNLAIAVYEGPGEAFTFGLLTQESAAAAEVAQINGGAGQKAH